MESYDQSRSQPWKKIKGKLTQRHVHVQLNFSTSQGTLKTLQYKLCNTRFNKTQNYPNEAPQPNLEGLEQHPDNVQWSVHYILLAEAQ